MSRKIFDRGSAVRMAAVFRVGTTPTDPSTVKLMVLAPDGTNTLYVYEVDPELAKDSVGNYHRDVELLTEGLYTYRWEGTGTAQAAWEGTFQVRDSAFF